MHDKDAIERLHMVAESRLGRTLAGRFTLDRIIAIGGMATVYEATQAPLMRQVAVKVLHPTEVEAGRTDFFLREANAASGLRHPNIIAIVDFGQEDDGTLFLAMEYVPGIDLGDLLSDAFPLPLPRLISIAEQVCLALEVAHRAGVVHCDMKPSNVMVESVPGNPDFVKVVDFGISRVSNPDVEEEAPDEILGSAYYMAPEQALGAQVSPETDIYGLGAVLYAALTGNVPFGHVDEVALLDHIVSTAPAAPSALRPDLDIPAALDQIVLKAMAKPITERFRSAAELRLALLSLIDTRRGLADTHDSLDILLDDELFDVDGDVAHLLEFELDGTDDWGPVPDLPEFAELSDTAFADSAFMPGHSRGAAGASDTLDPPPFHIELAEPLDIDFELELGLEPDPLDLDPLDDEEPIELTEPARGFDLARIDTGAVHDPRRQPRQTGSFVGRGRTATLIGRQNTLERLRAEFARTRRGAVSVLLTGDYGTGRSFFIDHAVRILQQETGAVILSAELNPGDRERPYIALHQWAKAALACSRSRLPLAPTLGSDFDQDVFTSAPADPLNPAQRNALPTPVPAPQPLMAGSELSLNVRGALNDLQLGPLEQETLSALLTRWNGPRTSLQDDGYEDSRCFDGTALRLPETRRQLLRYAFDGLIRRLVQLSDETQRGAQNVPVILVVDGWEHCDGATRGIVRSLLAEGRSLPLLLLITRESDTQRADDTFPEEPSVNEELDAAAGEWDTEIRIDPFNLDDVAELVAQKFEEPVGDAAIEKLQRLSGGNPLLLKELLHRVAQNTVLSADAAIRQLPDDFAQVITAQIDGLSRQGKMLLAVCAVLGTSFPSATLRGTLPDDFDLDGTLAELIGSHILEPGEEQRLFFRIPALRDTAMRRMNPERHEALHRRFATVLQTAAVPIARGEAEVRLAVHCIKSGDPIGGIDHLLDAADLALERAEPELALRRFRQARLWTTRKLTRLVGNEEQLQSLVYGSEHDAGFGHDLFRQLHVRSTSATMGLFKAARKLGFKPDRDPAAVIPERLPTRALDQLKGELADVLPARLAAEAAIEIGRYLMSAELLQAARTALQTALNFARLDGELHLVLTAEVHLASCLHQLGKSGLAADLATECYAQLKSLGPPPPLTEPSQQLRGTVPLTLLGEICIDRGKYTLADEYLTLARRIAEADGDIDKLHEIHTHRARLAHLQNRPADTVQALETAREVAYRAHDLRAQARVLYNLGVTLAMNGHTRRAEQQLRLAAFIAQALAWREFTALVDDQLRNLK